MNSDILETTIMLRQVEQFEKTISTTSENTVADQQVADHWNSILGRTKNLFGSDDGPLIRSIAHLSILYDHEDDFNKTKNYHYVRSGLGLIKGSLLAFFDLKQAEG